MESVAILIIGDEILSGEIRDENGPYLLKVLNDAGVRVERIVVVPDRREEIVQELRHLRAVADAVVVSGGLGPTHDDVTRPAVAESVGVELEPNAEAVERVRGFYADRATDAELAMADMPRGAALVNGRRTPTFGFRIAGVYALPGVPYLFRDIAERLPEEFETKPLHKRELASRRREGEIAPHLAKVQGECPDVAIGSYPVYEKGSWHVRVVLRATDEARLAEVAARLEPTLA